MVAGGASAPRVLAAVGERALAAPQPAWAAGEAGAAGKAASPGKEHGGLTAVLLHCRPARQADRAVAALPAPKSTAALLTVGMGGVLYAGRAEVVAEMS
jgi:hypothetical protein